MALPADHYGALAQPDERVRVDVVENPVQVALSAYKAWLQVEQRKPAPYEGKWFGKGGLDGWDAAYEHAASLLEPHAKAFNRVKSGELETILAGIPADEEGRNGFFLSALLNATDLRMLDGVFRHKNVGYHLKRGKRIIAREGSEVTDLGFRSQGDILNFGSVEREIGFESRGGIHINWGTADAVSPAVGGIGVRVNYGRAGSIGSNMTGGIIVNYGSATGFHHSGGLAVNYGTAKCTHGERNDGVSANYGTIEEYMAEQAPGGVCINYGIAGRMAWRASGGVQVNLGTVEGTMAYGAKWPSLQVSTGRAGKNHIHHRFRRWRDRLSKPAQELQEDDRSRAVRLAERLDRKLRRLAPLARLKDRPEEAYAWLRGFPYRAFEREVLALCRPLEERHAYANAERMRLWGRL
jgi:hypothetical protein